MRPLLPLLGLLLSSTACTERAVLEGPPLPAQQPQLLHFAAHPVVIHRGEKVTLRWEARTAAPVTLEQAIDPKADVRAEFRSLGTFPSSGSLEVYPQANTTYIVTCESTKIGCVSATVQVIVK